MTSLAKWRFYISIIRTIISFGTVEQAVSMAAVVATWFSPHSRRAREVVRVAGEHMQMPVLPRIAMRRRFLQNVGVCDASVFSLSRIDSAWLRRAVRTFGLDELWGAYHGGRGVLLMTYHHHHNFLLCSVMGLLGFRTSVIAMDPRQNPLYASFKDIADRTFRDSESHLNGGRYLYVHPNAPYVRRLHRVLDDGMLLITANDFQSPALSKRQIATTFLGRSLSVPVGSVEIAISRQARIAVGYLRWIEGGKFELHIHLLNHLAGTKGIMRQYFRQLELLVRQDPAFWEWTAFVGRGT